MKGWPVKNAKARFSELLVACEREGPQLSPSAASGRRCWFRSRNGDAYRPTPGRPSKICCYPIKLVLTTSRFPPRGCSPSTSADAFPVSARRSCSRGGLPAKDHRARAELISALSAFAAAISAITVRLAAQRNADRLRPRIQGLFDDARKDRRAALRRRQVDAAERYRNGRRSGERSMRWVGYRK